MKIKYLIGDATVPVGDGTKIIAHICNDMGGWGRGFVLALSSRWPVEKGSSSPEACYRRWKKQNHVEYPFVLGQIQTVWVEDTTFVCNMIAQRDYRPLQQGKTLLNIPNINYSSLLECLTRLKIELYRALNEQDFEPNDKISINMPRIGAGLGGGDWTKIEKIINSVFEATELPVYVYDPTPVAGTTYDKP